MVLGTCYTVPRLGGLGFVNGNRTLHSGEAAVEAAAACSEMCRETSKVVFCG